ncbi:MAG: hypothetical protein VB076_11375 [Synergistaceae bacterium]|nr:hypothetical protein [Synergistaceae bacterium]
MDTLYAHIKDNIILAIEKSSFATYAKIDFREADSFGLCLKKEIHLYRRLLSEFKFDLIHEDKGLLLYVHPDKTLPISNLIKETMDDYITKMERECV